MSQPLPFQEHASKLVELGRHHEAILVCEKWVEDQPGNAQAWYLKSFCELNTNQAIAGHISAQRANTLAPENEQIQAQLATTLIGKGQVKEGMELCRKIASKKNVYPGTLERAATALALAGEPAEAIPLYRRAIQLDPENSRFYSHLATALNQTHQPEQAEDAFRAAIALRPDRFGLYWQLVELRKATPESNYVKIMRGTLKQNSASQKARMYLNYSLGRQLEELEKYDDAFHHLQLGAEAMLEHTPCDIALERDNFNRLRELYPSTAFQDQSACLNDEPIFIVGMPRTGTTLLEQIIQAGADVFAAGELTNFSVQLAEAFGRLNPDKRGAASYVNAEQLDYSALGEGYIESTRPRTGHTAHFIDKYPLNFQFVGAIARALPRARFINLCRNPMDTCFSNFKLLFHPGSAIYSYRLSDLATYYAEYRKLMAHWHNCIPERIIDVHYEELTANPESESRRVYDFLGLEWTPACLEFYKSDSAVATASTRQVRQPIYRTSVAKWKLFEQQLQPLKDALLAEGVAV